MQKTSLSSHDILEGHERRVPTWMLGLGASLVVLQGAVQAVFGGPAELLSFDGVLSVGLTGFFAVPVVGTGVWLRRSDVSADRYPRIAAWCVGILVVILALNLLMIVAWPADTFVQNVSWAVQAAEMGAAGGAVFGSIEARAIERARVAERESVRSEQLEARREWLEYLNGLLRHEVLNTANVITGYSEMLIEDHDGDERTREYLERVARQSRKMADVIQDVRLLIQATNEDVQFETVDVVSVLSEEIESLEDRHEGVVVSTGWPDSAVVSADDLVGRVFSNLLENAVLHNDADVPRIDVEVRTDPEAVTVTVADNGSGIPDDERDALFERSGRGDHGLGLYLVRTLLARYGGSIDLAETGPEGTTFAVELPRASGEPQAAVERPAVMVDAV